jgi:hypothetical protein
VTGQVAPANAVRLLAHDDFRDRRRRGRVVGTASPSGVMRHGRDPGRSIAIDDDALRVVSLIRAGWGEATVSYGPYPVEPGLAFAALVLNGHNTAQHEPLGESLIARAKRWMKGNEDEPWPAHVLAWARHGRRAWTIRRFRHWVAIDLATRRNTLQPLDENLSVGIVPDHTSRRPTTEGCSFVMHATGAENGELWACTPAGSRPVLRSVQNVPLYLMVVVRRDTVVFLAGSIADVRGLPALPAVRPLAVAPAVGLRSAYAAIQQAVSGQIGFAADTRVWDAAIADVGEWLAGAALVDESLAHLPAGSSRTWAPPVATGLLRVTAAEGTDFVLDWHGDGRGSRMTCTVRDGAITVARVDDGDVTVLHGQVLDATGDGIDVQVVDDGSEIGVFAQGQLVVRTASAIEGGGTEICVGLERGRFDAIEAYAREVALPAALAFEPPPAPRAAITVIDETFDGAPGDLDGRAVAAGGAVWARAAGTGRVLVGDGEARVDASATSPLQGRTTYLLPWQHSGAVELEIEVTPPGQGRGDGERGRAGVVFWQDDDNAVIVSTWLDDHYDGTSMSSFFRLGGYEDLYDAVWTNLGRRISWGRRYRLRVVFDGMIYAAYVDDELVLYRRLTDVHPGQGPLRVNRVGLVANWEWGTDTGSVFHRFRARACDEAGEDRR